MPYLRIDTNPLSYSPSGFRIARDFFTVHTHLTGTLPFQVTVTGSVDSTEVLRNTTGVRKVLSVSAIVRGEVSTSWGLAKNDALPDLVAAQETWRAWANANTVQLQWRRVAAQIHGTADILRQSAVIAVPAMGLIAALSGWSMFFRTWGT